MARKAETGPNVITGAFLQRPEPPSDMTPKQKEVWKRVAKSEPPNWFQSQANQDMLRMYCQTVETIDTVQDHIDAFPVASLVLAAEVRRYDGLCRIRQKSIMQAIQLATKLRITNQSRYDRKLAATMTRNEAVELNPWEEDE